MVLHRIGAALLAAALSATVVPVCEAQYATDWIANTYGTNATRVGNVARSMWVAPEGVIYTSSMWDENEGGVAIYQNGQSLGSIGGHGDFQGGAITGNATSLFVAMQYNASYGSGTVGRYSRGSGTRELLINVSADTTGKLADVVTGLATSGSLLYASDFPGNRVRVFTTEGVWQRDIGVSAPGALAVDAAGNLWVAQKSAGAVLEFSPGGQLLNTVQLAASARPSSLDFDSQTSQLMIGDSGPDMNIKLYNVAGAPYATGTFGVRGGYLDTTTGAKGQAGDKRFMRVAGIGKDSAGNLYVLNNPWGGSWDLGRNGGTDIQAYDGTGTLRWKLQSVNFEGNAAPDPATDGALFYGGMNVYSGTAGGTFVANTIDPVTYPSDPRINLNDSQRGEHFAQLASVGGQRILVAAGQNPDTFYFFHFNASSGYIAIPDYALPGSAFGTTAPVRNGFCLDGRGDLWVGLDKSNVISHYPLTGFDASGKPHWGAAITAPIPGTIARLTRILYLPESDTMILAGEDAGVTDWTAVGTRVEVYHGWLAGNRSTPNPVINLTSANPKSIAAAGNYLFVGYVHTVPNIDAFNLTTGAIDTTFVDSSPSAVYVGNDVDSMYGVRAYRRSTGEFVVTRDNYNGASVVVYRWTPAAASMSAATAAATVSPFTAK
ncbi:SMP-30/gluconolactonase/LRE family protein [Paraburkholderia lycopersici]|uniref:SMP-30/Gluconolaconase/LRE-like region-containing protein n=1 Tax=Paraburkholderia lycopersici TaxID=416944 RepID=A0A1G6IVN8_9BURK|nr:SMP-30/gluconolactonase/LRE family protein [Paraburkholderia lycopersici]SDC10085.1 SMP-30/Gluconolaconase/LRE-like region-containing protein [Paraburkholderia lycopersici]